MKKSKWLPVLCALLILALTLPLMPAGADQPELASLSDEELLELLARVNAEIVSRNLEKTAELRKGSYIAGRDLPCGTYIYTCRATGNDWGNVTVYSQKGKGNQLLWEIVSAPEDGEEPESFLVTLEKDDCLESGVPFTLTVYAGVRFK